ncbi:50S ribosomal protein L10 [bacterium HR40]|nr:50S ribosomal protein L10 [bacterium HR40]
MLRAQKSKVVEDLHAVLGSTAVVVVTHYKGLDVAELSELRRRLREAGGRFKVVKNRLVKRALPGTPYERLADLFTGPTAIAWADDPVAAPRVVVEFAKKNDKLAIRGGGLAGTLLDAEAVRQLAALPSLDELRGKLIALLQTPASRLVGVLRAPGGKIARVLAARAEQQGGQE